MDGMEPAEVEFLAEKEQITIVPNFSENKLYLISVGFTVYPIAWGVLTNISPYPPLSPLSRERWDHSTPPCRPRYLFGWP